MKKILILLTVFMMFSVVVKAENDISIIINGEKFETEVQPVMRNSRLMVPMRAIFEELNAEIIWDGDKKEVTALKGDLTINLAIGDSNLYVNGEAREVDSPAIIENNRTLVPLRVVSESLGAKVGWDAETRTASIDYKEIGYNYIIKAEIEIENMGVMKLDLYPEAAPVTVENFVKLANEGFYDGLVFHRIIEGFMIQGGGYDLSLENKETEAIVGEFAANGYANDLKHTRGVISMARTMVPDSATSQFFIMHEDAPHLDGMYAAFGKLTDGFDILDKIATTETGVISELGMADVPIEAIVIKTVRIVEEV